MTALSIVIPVLDEAADIVAALEALGALRARGAEIIVVDGGSRDGTPALAAVLADRVLSSPRGRAALRHHRVRRARPSRRPCADALRHPHGREAAGDGHGVRHG